jgi:HK97 family phage prohead protease
MLLKVATTAADEGIFEAVISAATIDREKDIVDPSAMVDALQKWTPTGKKIPLAWNHSSQSADQIGYVDPASARVVKGEVAVSGWIDQSTPVGADAWRLVKMGTLGFSFGYMIPDGGAAPRKGGGLHITELDVFEVTATPTPMNNDTRVLGFKADMDVETKLQEALAELAQVREQLDGLQKKADESERNDRSMDPLRAQTARLALEIASDGESLIKPPQAKATPPEPGMTLADMRDWWYAQTMESLSEDLK